jgi:hypothetical protein
MRWINSDASTGEVHDSSKDDGDLRVETLGRADLWSQATLRSPLRLSLWNHLRLKFRHRRHFRALGRPLPSPHKQAVQASASTLAPVPASSFTPAPVPVLGATNSHRHTSAGRAPFRDDVSVPAAAPSVPIPTRRSSFASVEGNLPLVFGRGEAAPPHDVSRQRVQDDHSDGFDFTLTATGQTGSLVLRSASNPGNTAPAGGREELRANRHGLPASQLKQAGRSRWAVSPGSPPCFVWFSHRPPTTGQILSPAEGEAMLLRICQGFRSPQRRSTGGRLQEDAPGPTARTAVSDSGRRRRTRRLRTSCTGRRGHGSEDHPRTDAGSRTREALRRAQRVWAFRRQQRRRLSPRIGILAGDRFHLSNLPPWPRGRSGLSDNNTDDAFQAPGSDEVWQLDQKRRRTRTWRGARVDLDAVGHHTEDAEEAALRLQGWRPAIPEALGSFTSDEGGNSTGSPGGGLTRTTRRGCRRAPRATGQLAVHARTTISGFSDTQAGRARTTVPRLAGRADGAGTNEVPTLLELAGPPGGPVSNGHCRRRLGQSSSRRTTTRTLRPRTQTAVGASWATTGRPAWDQR